MKTSVTASFVFAMLGTLSIAAFAPASNAALISTECRGLFKTQQERKDDATFRFSPSSTFGKGTTTTLQSASDPQSNQLATIERLNGDFNPLSKSAHTHIRITDLSNPKLNFPSPFDSRPVVALARAQLVGGGEELVPVRIDPWNPMHPSYSMFHLHDIASHTDRAEISRHGSSPSVLPNGTNPIRGTSFHNYSKEDLIRMHDISSHEPPFGYETPHASPNAFDKPYVVLLPKASAIGSTSIAGVFLVGTTEGKVWLVGRDVQPVELNLEGSPKFSFIPSKSTSLAAASSYATNYISKVELFKIPNLKFIGLFSYRLVVTRSTGQTDHYDLDEAAHSTVAEFRQAVKTAANPGKRIFIKFSFDRNP